MNYYDFHVGDFRSATSHLTRTERSIYRDMIDMYYDTEQPLPLDLKILNRKLAARDEEEKEAVLALLDEFFIKTESGYFNNRCDEEIQKYHNNQSKKSLAGKASAAKREQERIARLALLNGEAMDDQLNTDSDEHLFQQDSTGVEQVMDSSSSSVQLTNNQEPITNNQEPINKNPNSSASEVKNAALPKSQEHQTYGQALTPQQIIDLWQPDQKLLAEHLKFALAKPVEPAMLTEILIKFNTQYEHVVLTQNQKHTKLAGWIKDAQSKQERKPKLATASKSGAVNKNWPDYIPEPIEVDQEQQAAKLKARGLI